MEEPKDQTEGHDANGSPVSDAEAARTLDIATAELARQYSAPFDEPLTLGVDIAREGDDRSAEILIDANDSPPIATMTDDSPIVEPATQPDRVPFEGTVVAYRYALSTPKMAIVTRVHSPTSADLQLESGAIVLLVDRIDRHDASAAGGWYFID